MKDDSSIGKSMGQPVIMLNDHNQPDSIATWFYHLLGHCRMCYSSVECDTASYITFKMSVITV